MLLDTNILVEILKENPVTLEQMQGLKGPLAISSVTAMELIYGARNKQEVQKIQRFIRVFHVLHLNEDISLKALQLVTEYAKSHTLDIPDSLIASTALNHKCALFTYNIKGFQFIPDLELLK